LQASHPPKTQSRHATQKTEAVEARDACASTAGIDVVIISPPQPFQWSREERREAAQALLRRPEDKNLRQRIFGTGIVISEDGYVLTAKHVIDAAKDTIARLNAIPNTRAESFISFYEPRMDVAGHALRRANFEDCGYDLVDEDVINDLVLLKTNCGASSRFSIILQRNHLTAARFSESNAIATTRIRTCGYPFGIPEPAITFGRIASATVTATDAGYPVASPEMDVQLVDTHLWRQQRRSNFC
jgi:S1-C subfamily serine protease